MTSANIPPMPSENKQSSYSLNPHGLNIQSLLESKSKRDRLINLTYALEYTDKSCSVNPLKDIPLDEILKVLEKKEIVLLAKDKFFVMHKCALHHEWTRGQKLYCRVVDTGCRFESIVQYMTTDQQAYLSKAVQSYALKTHERALRNAERRYTVFVNCTKNTLSKDSSRICSEIEGIVKKCGFAIIQKCSSCNGGNRKDLRTFAHITKEDFNRLKES